MHVVRRVIRCRAASCAGRFPLFRDSFDPALFRAVCMRRPQSERLRATRGDSGRLCLEAGGMRGVGCIRIGRALHEALVAHLRWHSC